MQRPEPWTRKELKEFVELYPSTPMETLMLRFKRSYRSLSCKAHDLRVTKSESYRVAAGKAAHLRAAGPRRPYNKIKWTSDMISQLLADYPNTPNADLATRYGVTTRAIGCIAQKRGITKSAAYRTLAGQRTAATRKGVSCERHR